MFRQAGIQLSFVVLLFHSIIGSVNTQLLASVVATHRIEASNLRYSFASRENISITDAAVYKKPCGFTKDHVDFNVIEAPGQNVSFPRSIRPDKFRGTIQAWGIPNLYTWEKR